MSSIVTLNDPIAAQGLSELSNLGSTDDGSLPTMATYWQGLNWRRLHLYNRSTKKAFLVFVLTRARGELGALLPTLPLAIVHELLWDIVNDKEWLACTAKPTLGLYYGRNMNAGRLFPSEAEHHEIPPNLAVLFRMSGKSAVKRVRRAHCPCPHPPLPLPLTLRLVVAGDASQDARRRVRAQAHLGHDDPVRVPSAQDVREARPLPPC